MNDAQRDAASQRFVVVVEDEGARGWVKMGLYAAVFALTFGLLDLYPKIFVRVRDRRTGEELVTQTWRSPGAAEEAMTQLQMDLERLTPEQFLSRWTSQLPPRRP